MLSEKLEQFGFNEHKANLCAKIFTESSRDGITSHGLNRFPTFINYIKKGYVKPEKEPVLMKTSGAIEIWDGQLGPGPLNAKKSMERAIQLAKTHTIGCLALQNTNHWMRGGTYGWQAAEAGMAAICFTNTLPNMPPWGGKENRLGNNPLVIAIPNEPAHLVLDMAMTQFAYGKITDCRLRGVNLPVAAGYDSEGVLTMEPTKILEGGRILPAGFWKGSGLSLMLDLLGALLSGGRTSRDIGQLENEYGISQIFICFDLASLHAAEELKDSIKNSLDYLKSSATVGDEEITYPGERTFQRRAESNRLGILVDQEIWEKVKAL